MVHVLLSADSVRLGIFPTADMPPLGDGLVENDQVRLGPPIQSISMGTLKVALMRLLIVVALALLTACTEVSTREETDRGGVGANAKGMDEMEMRSSIRVEVTNLWNAQDYRTLDTLGQSYLSKRERTPSGLWKISVFSDALKDQINVDLDDTEWSTYMEKQIRAWPRLAPTSAFAHMQVAAALVKRGWYKRGNGYARDVSAEGWRSFHQYIEEARLSLESTKEVSSANPSWYFAMLEIATWQRWEAPRQWSLLQEAMARDREYFPNYFVALNYYSPKWGGDPAKMEALASRIASEIGGKEGDALYARMYWWAADNHFGRQLIYSKVDCARMLRGMKNIASDFPDPWNINRFAAFSVDCGDKPSARQYFDQIGDKPQLDAWGGSMATF